MARISDPTNIKILKGVDKKNPNRVNHNEPASGELGNHPLHFEEKNLISIWNEIKSNVADGVFQSSDRIALEVCCVLLFEFRSDPVNFPTMKHGKLESYLSKFGMTPTDRSKIIVAKKTDDNPFKDFD